MTQKLTPEAAQKKAAEAEARAKLEGERKVALAKKQPLEAKKESKTLKPGFAEVAKPTEFDEAMNRLSTKEKLDLLTEALNNRKLTEQQEMNIRNLVAVKELYQAMSGVVKQEADRYQQWAKSKDRYPQEFWEKLKPKNVVPDQPNWLIDHFDELVIQATRDEHFSLKKALPADVSQYMDRKLKTMEIDTSDVKDKEALLQKENELIASLRRQHRYDELEATIDQSLEEEFKKGIALLGEAEKTKFRSDSVAKVEKEIAEASRYWKEGERPDPTQFEQYKKDLIEFHTTRSLHQAVAKRFLGDQIPLSGAKAKIWEQYQDIYDPKQEWLRLTDAQAEESIKFVVINAPLIFISGGIASGIRLGAGMAASRLLATQGIKLVGKTLVQRLAIGATTYAAGQYVEGAAFDMSHRLLQGQWYEDLPDFAKSTLFSAVTLGLFHGSGKLAESFFTKNIVVAGVSKNVSRFKFLEDSIGKIKNPAIQEAMKQLMVKGHVEAATMLFTSAAQKGLYEGNLDEFWKSFNGDELFRAYVSVGALKASGKMVETIKAGTEATTTDQMKRHQAVEMPAIRMSGETKADRGQEPAGKKAAEDKTVPAGPAEIFAEGAKPGPKEEISRKPDNQTPAALSDIDFSAALGKPEATTGSRPTTRLSFEPETIVSETANRSTEAKTESLDKTRPDRSKTSAETAKAKSELSQVLDMVLIKRERLIQKAQVALDITPANLEAAIQKGALVLEGLPGTDKPTEAYPLKKVGAGGLGVVHEIFYENANGKIVKVLIKSSLDRRNWLEEPDPGDYLEGSRRVLEGEAEIMGVINSLGNNPNLMKVHERPVRDTDGQIHVVLENAGNVSARHLVYRAENAQSVESVIFQTIEGAEFLWGKGFIHRDLKLANVMVDSVTGQARIIDFGTLSALPNPKTPAQKQIAQLNEKEMIEMNGGATHTPIYTEFTPNGTGLNRAGLKMLDEMGESKFRPEYDQFSIMVMIAEARDALVKKGINIKGTPLERMAAEADKAKAAKTPEEIRPIYKKIQRIRDEARKASFGKAG